MDHHYLLMVTFRDPSADCQDLVAQALFALGDEELVSSFPVGTHQQFFLIVSEFSPLALFARAAGVLGDLRIANKVLYDARTGKLHLPDGNLQEIVDGAWRRFGITAGRTRTVQRFSGQRK